MRYPMVRKNNDGTEVIVNNAQEAYSKPEEIACFLPEKPIPESAFAIKCEEAHARIVAEIVREELHDDPPFKPLNLKAGKRGK